MKAKFHLPTYVDVKYDSTGFFASRAMDEGGAHWFLTCADTERQAVDSGIEAFISVWGFKPLRVEVWRQKDEGQGNQFRSGMGDKRL